MESNIQTEQETSVEPGASMVAMVLDDTALLADRYRIIEKLGQGGMAEVYLGVHTVIGKQVAIKLLRPELVGRATIVERFLQEARAASIIRHKHIVDITDFGHSPSGRPFFVMEYLEGESLQRTLRREGPLEWRRAIYIIAQIARALDAAHAEGIIHRDVKPANCIRVRDPDDPDFIKVLDFGIAKVVGHEAASQELTEEGVVIGTARYMSPEQAQSEPLDQRADIYSLGIMLYEMLVGRAPFRGKGFLGTIAMQVTAPPPSFAELAPAVDFPSGLEELVRKALEKDPALRWQSAREMALALEEFVKQTDSYVAPAAPLMPSLMSAKAPSERSRGATPFIAGGLALLLAAGVGIWSLLPGDHDASIAAEAEAALAGEAIAATVAEGEEGEEGENGTPTTPSADVPEATAATAATTATAATAATQEVIDDASKANADDRSDESAEPSAARGDQAPRDRADAPTPTVAKAPATKRGARPSKKSKPAAKDSPKSAKTETPTQRSREALRGALTKINAKIKDCGKHGGMPGMSVKVALEIAVDGKVKSAKAKAPFHGSPLGRCVEEEAAKVRFGPAGAAQQYTHAFKM